MVVVVMVVVVMVVVVMVPLVPLLLSGSAVQQIRAGGTRRESMVAVGVGGVAMREVVSLVVLSESLALALALGNGGGTREGWPELESRAGVTDMARVLACSGACFPLVLVDDQTKASEDDTVVACGVATGGIVVNTRSGSPAAVRSARFGRGLVLAWSMQAAALRTSERPGGRAVCRPQFSSGRWRTRRDGWMAGPRPAASTKSRGGPGTREGQTGG